MTPAAQVLRYTIAAPLNQVVPVLSLLVRTTQSAFTIDREPGPEAGWRLYRLPDRRESGRFTFRELTGGRTELVVELYGENTPAALALVASIVAGLSDYGFPVESPSSSEAPTRPPAILLVASTPRFFQALSSRLEPVAERNGFLLRYLPPEAVDDSAGFQRGIAAARMLIADLTTRHGGEALTAATASGCLVVPIAPAGAPVPAEWKRRTLEYGPDRPGFLRDLLDRVTAGALGERRPGPGGAASAADFIDQTVAMPALAERERPVVRLDDSHDERAGSSFPAVPLSDEDRGASSVDLAIRPGGAPLALEPLPSEPARAGRGTTSLSALQSLVSLPPADARLAIYRTVAFDPQADPEQRFHAARVLATHGDREAAAVAVASLIRAGVPMRSEALSFLDSLGSAAAVALWTLDATQQTPEESIAIALRLHAIGDSATARVRLESLAHHPDRATRRAALEALSGLGPVAYAEFERLVRDARDPRVRLDAARWLRLYELDLAQVVETLTELADQADSPTLALGALQELAAVRTQAAFEALVALTHSASLDSVRHAAVEALRRRGEAERACSDLLSVATSDKGSAALGAAEALFELSRDSSVVARLLDSASVPAVRLLAARRLATPDWLETLQHQAARELLAQNQIAWLLPVLERLAETAVDGEIRRWAAEQLAVLDSPSNAQGEEAAAPVVLAGPIAMLDAVGPAESDESPLAEERIGSLPESSDSGDWEYDSPGDLTLWSAMNPHRADPAEGSSPAGEGRVEACGVNEHQIDNVQKERSRELLAEGKINEALPLLYRLALTAADQSIRGWALEQLATLEQSSIPTVLEVLNATDDPAAGVPLADAVLLTSTDATTHRQVAAWLAGHGQARRATEVLAAVVEDPWQPEDVVEAALTDLLRMAATHHEAVTTIGLLAREARSDSVRRQALSFLLHYHVEELESLGILIDPEVRQQLLVSLPPPVIEPAGSSPKHSRGKWSLPEWLVGGLEQLNLFLPGGGRKARASHEKPVARSADDGHGAEEHGSSARETTGKNEPERDPMALQTWVEVVGRHQAEPGDQAAEAPAQGEARDPAAPASLTDLLRADGVLDTEQQPAQASTSERTEVCLVGLKSFGQVVEFQKALQALPEVNRVEVHHIQEGMLTLHVFHRPGTDLEMSLKQLAGFDLRVSAVMPGVLSLEVKAGTGLLGDN